MKKLILLIFGLMVITSSALALSPEELKGKWVSNKISESDPNGTISADQVITLKLDGVDKVTYTQSSNMNLSLGEGIKIYTYNELVAEGGYIVAGDSITITLTQESVKMNITEDDIRIIGIDDVAEVEEAKREFVEQTQKSLPMAAEQIAAHPVVFNNVVILPKKMTAMNNGKMINFKKK